MSDLGLRERKKLRTRRLIADTAARLFAQRGYEGVTVSDIAREAEVSEQTVYNYFAGKEQLVTDLDEQVQARLCELVGDRPPGTSPVGAIRDFTLEFVEGIRQIDPRQARGELGYLAAVSPAVHRLLLEMSDRQATALADVIAATGTVTPELARLQAIALAGVFQIIVREAGRRAHAGQGQDAIADELRPVVAEMLESLDRWI